MSEKEESPSKGGKSEAEKSQSGEAQAEETEAEQARIAAAAKAGINKLFDAMQNDLGTQ